MHTTVQAPRQNKPSFDQSQATAEGTGTTFSPPGFSLDASSGFGTETADSSTAIQPLSLIQRKTPSYRDLSKPGPDIAALADLRKVLKSQPDIFLANKVFPLLKKLSPQSKARVLKEEKTYLAPMVTAFSHAQMAKALKLLNEVDAFRALKYYFAAGSFADHVKDEDTLYFLSHGTPASLQKVLKSISLGFQLNYHGMNAPLTKTLVFYRSLSGAKVKEEVAGGISSKEKIGGNTVGFLNMRALPNTRSSNVLGALDGSMDHQVTITDKFIGGGHTWYKATFKNPAVYKKLLKPNKPQHLAVQAAIKGNYAWISARGLNLHVSYAQFLKQLEGWEKANAKLTVKQRITKLRQMCHSSKLIFDHVIGRSAGSYYADNRPDLSGLHQLLQHAQGVKMPDGRVIDMYHFIVGLDVLQPGNPRVANKRYWGLSVGENHAAATWAGDIGAGVAEMVLNAEKKKLAYEKHFKKQEKAAKKAKKPFNMLETRRNYYFKARAPEADLLADIDAWAGAAHVGKPGMNSVSAIVRKYYGGKNDVTGAQLTKNRSLAIKNFLRNYGFTSIKGLSSQTKQAQHMEQQILKFAWMWMYKAKYRTILWMGGYKALLAREAKAMNKIFLDWLEKQAQQYKVKL